MVESLNNDRLMSEDVPSVLILAGMALCNAYDAVRLPFGARMVVGCEWAAFGYACVVAVAAAVCLPLPAAFAALALADALLAAGLAALADQR